MLPQCGMGGGFRFIAQRQEIFSIVPLAKLDARGNQTTAPTAAQRWTVTTMTDFYFAIGQNKKDVFVVVGDKWILYKHCETEELARAIVEGQNKRREGKR